MKKLTLVCSALLLSLSLAGCGNQDKHSEKHSSVKSEKVKSSSSSKKSSSSSKSSSLSMSSSSSVVSSTAQTSSIENTQQSQNTTATNNQQSQTTNNANTQQSQNNYDQNENQWAQQQGYQDPNSTAARMGYAANCVDNGYYPDGTPISAERQEEINKQRGYDTKGNPVMPGQGHAPGCDPFGNSDSWVAGQ